MILHFLVYDSLTGNQFSDYVVRQFSYPEMRSDFVAISSLKNLPKQVYHQEKVRVVDPSSEAFESLLSSLRDYSAIVFHGLFYPWCERVLKSVPETVKVAWEFWGGEIYGRCDLVNQMLAPFSRCICMLHDKLKRKELCEKWELPFDLFQRIDYCLTAQREEFDFASRYIGSSHIKHLWFTYYSIEETVGSLIDKQSNGDNLWFCHNANVESNAFDALFRFVFLKKYKKHIKNISVIMPLSYGSPWIRNLFLEIGPRVFKHSFKPMITFLEREEYNRCMLSCSTLVLPGYRPAGQGNIITALWLGMRVYLSEKCISFGYFKRIGAVVFSFESDFPRFGCSRISKEEVKTNRMVLYGTFGRANIDNAVANVVSVLS